MGGGKKGKKEKDRSREKKKGKGKERDSSSIGGQSTHCANNKVTNISVHKRETGRGRGRRKKKFLSNDRKERKKLL